MRVWCLSGSTRCKILRVKQMDAWLFNKFYADINLKLYIYLYFLLPLIFLDSFQVWQRRGLLFFWFIFPPAFVKSIALWFRFICSISSSKCKVTSYMIFNHVLFTPSMSQRMMLSWNRMTTHLSATSSDTPCQLDGELFIQFPQAASSCLHFINNKFNQAVIISQFPKFLFLIFLFKE